MTFLPPANIPVMNIHTVFAWGPYVIMWTAIFLAWYWLGFMIADSHVDSFLFRVVGTSIFFLTVIVGVIIISAGLMTIYQSMR